MSIDNEELSLGRVLLLDSDLTVVAGDQPAAVGARAPVFLAEAAGKVLEGAPASLADWRLSLVALNEGNGILCERRGDDTALDAGHDSFLRVIENNPFGIYLVDQDFRLAKVSIGATKVFENVQPHIGRDFAEVIRVIWPDPFATEAIARFRHTLETGEPYHSQDTEEKRSDTEELEAYDWKIERVSLPHGKFGVVCYFYDLTEQMKLRNDLEFLADFVVSLRQVSAEVAVFEEATKNIALYFNASKCFVSEVDPTSGEIVSINGELKDGLRLFQSVDTLVDGEAWVCDDTSESEEWAHTAESKIAAAIAVPRFSDGNCVSISILASSVPRKWEKREIALVKNVADRLWSTVSALRLEDRVRTTQRLESIGILAGGIAHDFNNLLTGILGASDLAADLVDDGSTVKGYLQTITRAGERAADLTSQLLAYAGKGQSIVEPLNLAAFVKGATQLLRISMPSHVTLEFELNAEDRKILADRGQVQQVLMNLVLNAAEAIPEEERGSVAVRTKHINVDQSDLFANGALIRVPPGEYLLLQVADDGAGMDPETRGKIFDPFFTTKFLGRGLGLAAVLGIVSSHKGGIAIESEPGCGTTFSVLFPVLPQTAPVAAVEGVDGEQAFGGTVLVVDDEDVVREFAMAALSAAGFSVLSAENGQQCLDVFHKQPEAISVVLLDMTMPVLGGQAAFEALRAARPDLPILVMSGYSDSEASGKFGGRGGYKFIRKPFTVSGLCQAVQESIQTSN